MMHVESLTDYFDGHGSVADVKDSLESLEIAGATEHNTLQPE